MNATIKHIQNLAINNGQFPDTISIKESGDLILLTYKACVQFDNSWTDFEIVCRGLIINRITGEIVARPFDKFFNWGENNRTTNADIKSITEKLDGSLGILYRNNGYKIATRGSFESEQAIWATEYYNKYHGLLVLKHEWTLLFEIIYPENRIVIDYGERQELVLLAIRNRFTGKYLNIAKSRSIAMQCGFGFPKIYHFKTPQEIAYGQSKLSSNDEGWVVEFADGQRFKFKGDEYCKIHKLISGLSFKFVLENHQAGTLNQALEVIPDEFKDEVNGWIDEIDNTVLDVIQEVEEVLELAPKTNRKDFALWVMEFHKNLAPYLFAKLDGKDILPIIYKMGFK